MSSRRRHFFGKIAREGDVFTITTILQLSPAIAVHDQ
jgi:hypothetical protein